MSSNKTFGARIDEIISTCDFEVEEFGSRICKWCGESKGCQIHTAKQAITSLIKELVAEAKPEITFSKPEGMPNTLAIDFAQRHLNEFEQNLLKALEEV